jgi:hypothetical protein
MVDQLLSNCVEAICEEVALKQGITEPDVHPLAVESMVAAVDECTKKI